MAYNWRISFIRPWFIGVREKKIGERVLTQKLAITCTRTTFLINKGNKAPALARINIPLPSKMALQHHLLIPHTVRSAINHRQRIRQHHPVLGVET